MSEALASRRTSAGGGGARHGAPSATSNLGGAVVDYIPIERHCVCGNRLSGFNLDPEERCEACVKRDATTPAPKWTASLVAEVRDVLRTHNDYVDFFPVYRAKGYSPASISSAMTAAKRYFSHNGGCVVNKRGRGYKLVLREEPEGPILTE